MTDEQKRLAEIVDFLTIRAKAGMRNFSNSRCVQIIHKYEGTVLFFDGAMGIQEKGAWYIITEHNGNHYFLDQEVTVRFFEKVSYERGKGTLSLLGT